MKTFLITILFLTIFTSCSKNNAFSAFDIDQKQAKSEDSLQSAKFFDGTDIKGILSVIYLNRVLPDNYNDREYFYIYLYTKKEAAEVEFFLNGKEALEIKKLKPENEFSDLTSFSGDWQRYYLVAFKIQGEVLKLTVKTPQSSTREILFKKDN